MIEPQVDFNEPDTNQLAVIVQESGLEESKAKYILNRFQDYFTMADEWTKTTKQIVVTDASQTHLMDMARAARLVMREKRLDIEKARKEMKEQSLREGKAIDGIANVLKALIIPLEEYYAKQENFVLLKEAERAKLIEQEIQARLDKEFEEQQKFKTEEDARIRAENERLKQEALEREESIKEEAYRIEQERRKEQSEARAEQERIKREADEKARIERERVAEEQNKERAKLEKIKEELREKKEAEAKIERDRLAKEEALKKAGDSEKLEDLRDILCDIKMPKVNSQDSKIAIRSIKQNLSQSIEILTLVIKKEEVDF